MTKDAIGQGDRYEDAYLFDQNAEIYQEFRDCYARFYPSEQHAVDTAVADGATVLDVGCNTGGLFVALDERHTGLRHTGIDPDPRSLAIAAAAHPGAELIEGYFPDDRLEGRTFDAVFCLSLYTHFTEWKSMLAAMSRLSTGTLVVDVALTLEGPTITDPDVSYTYYLASGVRVPYVIINARQFINFCFTEQVDAESVEIVGVTPPATTGMPGVGREGMLRGVAIIRRDTTGLPFFAGQQAELNPSFVGGVNVARYRSPAATLTLDGVQTSMYPA